MPTIKCLACGYDNYIFDDDEEPTCEICDSSLEPVQANQDDDSEEYFDDIPF